MINGLRTINKGETFFCYLECTLVLVHATVLDEVYYMLVARDIES